MSSTPSEPQPVGVYVHLPFCRVRCSYCPFAISTDLDLEGPYVDALLREIELRTAGLQVDSLYFGGGTPSRLSPRQFRRLTAALRQLPWSEGIEVSLEANPEDVTPEALREWQAGGVNRLSIGVQSLDDEQLRPLGRLHGRELALKAIDLAVAAGMRTSADLILGLPDFGPAQFQSSVDEVVRRGVGHISVYILDLEEGTFLERQVQRGKVALPEDQLVSELYLDLIERLAAAGLEQYEISNFAREGHRSIHNLKYWQRKPYIGLGIGAHSFLARERQANTRSIREYITRLQGGELPIDFTEVLGEGEERREAILLSLRQVEGIGYSDLTRLCGPEGLEWIARGREEGWLQTTGERVAFTRRGFLLSNEYIAQLF